MSNRESSAGVSVAVSVWTRVTDTPFMVNHALKSDAPFAPELPKRPMRARAEAWRACEVSEQAAARSRRTAGERIRRDSTPCTGALGSAHREVQPGHWGSHGT